MKILTTWICRRQTSVTFASLVRPYFIAGHKIIYLRTNTVHKQFGQNTRNSVSLQLA